MTGWTISATVIGATTAECSNYGPSTSGLGLRITPLRSEGEGYYSISATTPSSLVIAGSGSASGSAKVSNGGCPVTTNKDETQA